MNDKVCIDASLALTWLLSVEQNEIANALRSKWDDAGVEIIAPPLFHAQVTSVLRQQVYLKRLPPEEGEEAFSTYLEMGVKSIDSPGIQETAWELAKRFDLPQTLSLIHI